MFGGREIERTKRLKTVHGNVDVEEDLPPPGLDSGELRC